VFELLNTWLLLDKMRGISQGQAYRMRISTH
jgi:hypothetical protein